MRLLAAGQSGFVRPLCLGEDGCGVRYPLRGHVEFPLDVVMNGRTEPTSDDPEAPGAILQWVPGHREAVLVFGNPPVRGRLTLDIGTFFTLSAADDDRFTGFWEDGSTWTVIGSDGRNLGGIGGWFCAERIPPRRGAAP